jgi:hypothetical protein
MNTHNETQLLERLADIKEHSQCCSGYIILTMSIKFV